jgi:hypothetical protein
MLDTTGGSVIDYDLNTFLHGNGQEDITTDSALIILPLAQNTYKLNVVVKGLDRNHDYAVAITDDNGNYYFDNTFVPSGALQYIREFGFAPEGRIQAALTTLRLDRGRSPKFTITDKTAHNVLVQKYLVEMILATGVPVDFATQHEFDIDIIYDSGTLSATISVNGWQIKTGDPEDLD